MWFSLEFNKIYKTKWNDVDRKIDIDDLSFPSNGVKRIINVNISKRL